MAPSSAPCELSIPSAFSGHSVLITGATGYLGSLLLEQLLRLVPDIKKVYVLARSSGSHSAQARIERITSSGLFRLVSDQALAKIQVVNGDLTLPKLGMAPEEYAAVCATTSAVIHSAASVSLNPHIHVALMQNYVATRNLLDAACTMSKLKLFLHVSSCYVNGNQPQGSEVQERLYPLVLNGKRVDHAVLVSQLMDMKQDAAELASRGYLDLWGFPGTYCLAKHLAEKLVAEYHARRSMPCAIVRPSIIGCLDGTPYPGYTGNLAGVSGIAAAFAVGFCTPGSSAWPGSNVIDVVPGDLVTSVTLATGAAVLLKAPAARLQQQQRDMYKIGDLPLIVHASTSGTYPLHVEGMANSAYDMWSANPPKYRLPFSRLTRMAPSYKPWPYRVWWERTMTTAKVSLLAWALNLAGYPRHANKLISGHAAWTLLNSPKYDFHLTFRSDMAKGLEALLPEQERAGLLLAWQRDRHCWHKYFLTYTAGIHRLCLREEGEVTNVEHGFKYYASRAAGRPEAGAGKAGAGGKR